MPEQRIIVKYPNRRLYDKKKNRYTTQRELVGLVRSEADIVVIRYPDKQDITRAVLFDTLREVESTRSTPRLGVGALCRLIREGR